MIRSFNTAKAVIWVFTRHGLFLFGAAASLSLGCSAMDFAELRPGIENRGHYIEGVPFSRQHEYDCGPAALASVLAYWGKTVKQQSIAEQICNPDLRGTLPMDMERYARDAGFITESRAGTLADLKAHIRGNRLVICLLDTGFGPYKQPHYVTVIGYDDVHRAVIVHDGRVPDRVIMYEAFDKEWKRAGRWMLVVQPKEGHAK